MSPTVNELPAVDAGSARLNVVVDTPKGSHNKYKFDEQRTQWRLSKVLPQGLSFPHDFGFLPSTRGEDGDPLDVLAGEADRLGEVLGHDHALAVLRQLLTDEPGRFGDESDREVLLALIDRRRAELEQEAMLLGRRFFQDSPGEFARRLKGYLKTWRAQAAPEPPEGNRFAMA
jgi:hypothetical protein